MLQVQVGEAGRGLGLRRPVVCLQAVQFQAQHASQLFGYWPVDLFIALPEQQQVAFWRAETKGRLEIQNALVKEVVDQREEEERTSIGGKYLPLDVWERKGFDVAKIKAQCKDTEEHPLLGTTYNVGLKTVTRDEIKKKVWKDLFKLSGAESAKKKKDKKKKQERLEQFEFLVERLELFLVSA